MNKILIKSCKISCLIVFFAFFVLQKGHAASLDSLYGPLLQKGQKLYRGEFSSFLMEEEGEQHGSSSFGRFESQPEYPSLRNYVLFSPASKWQIGLGYGKDFDADYTRLTFDDSTPAIDFNNRHELDAFHHFRFDLRRRLDQSEVYIRSYGNRQKAAWSSTNFSAGNLEPDFFTIIRSHYEDVHLGWRYVSEGGEVQGTDNFSKLVVPLLNKGQIDLDTQFEYKRGKVERGNEFLGTPSATRNYTHNLRSHFIPQIDLGVGLFNGLELRSGLSYEIPHRFQFEFQQFNEGGTSNFIVANYKTEKKVRLPLQLRYRPIEDFQVSFSSDTVFAEQTLTSYEKETDDTITEFPKKRLRYLNVKPTVELTYLYDQGKTIEPTPLNKFTKILMKEGQFLFDLKYQRDITHLRKNGANGAANILDAETIFRYPLDNFVAGTEYAAFLLGNSTLNTPDVHPQNYHKIEANFTYGLRDWFNTGIGVGYRSRSGVHQFTFADLASRQYQFEPYYYVNVMADWQVTQNSLLSFHLHHVPRYKTFMISSAQPETFEVKTAYTKTEVAFQFLF